MRRDASFVTGETYHLYNRGAHKQDIFTCESDCQRFLLLLFLANNTSSVNVRETLRKYKGQTFATIFEQEKRETLLVDILAYSLLPNHFHIVLRQKEENGITKFCRKLLTGYSMYFNTLYDHSGILSQGAVKSKHIGSEEYFRYIFAYVHLNPLSLEFNDWQKKGIMNQDAVRHFLNNYSYSSFYDYSTGGRPEQAILSLESTPDFLKTQNDLEELLAWGQQETFKGQTFESSDTIDK